MWLIDECAHGADRLMIVEPPKIDPSEPCAAVPIFMCLIAYFGKLNLEHIMIRQAFSEGRLPL